MTATSRARRPRGTGRARSDRSSETRTESIVGPRASVSRRAATCDQPSLFEVGAETAQIIRRLLGRQAVLSRQRLGRLLDASELVEQIEHEAPARVDAVVPPRIQVQYDGLGDEAPVHHVVGYLNPGPEDLVPLAQFRGHGACTNAHHIMFLAVTRHYASPFETVRSTSRASWAALTFVGTSSLSTGTAPAISAHVLSCEIIRARVTMCGMNVAPRRSRGSGGTAGVTARRSTASERARKNTAPSGSGPPAMLGTSTWTLSLRPSGAPRRARAGAGSSA